MGLGDKTATTRRPELAGQSFARSVELRRNGTHITDLRAKARRSAQPSLNSAVNGVRVHLEDGSWVLVRASSNKPELVVVVESMRSEDDMRDLFRKEVKPRLATYPEIGAFNQEI